MVRKKSSIRLPGYIECRWFMGLCMMCNYTRILRVHLIEQFLVEDIGVSGMAVVGN